MRHTLPIAVLTATASVLAPVSMGRADTFVAPATVTAQADGSFSYQCVFTKEAGSDLVGSYGWIGQENVGGGFSADCFCESFCAIGPGQQIVFDVEGQLADPELPGRVEESVTLCSAGPTQITTLVRPFSVTSAPGPGAPGELRFWNEPNPFSARTTFRYVVPAPGRVRLRIYDLAGRVVADLVDEVQAAGAHSVTWAAGARRAPGASGGVLFARLSIGPEVRGRTLVLVR